MAGMKISLGNRIFESVKVVLSILGGSAFRRRDGELTDLLEVGLASLACKPPMYRYHKHTCLPYLRQRLLWTELLHESGWTEAFARWDSQSSRARIDTGRISMLKCMQLSS